MASSRAWVCIWLVSCGGIAVIDGDDGPSAEVVEPFRCPDDDATVSGCDAPACWCGHGSCGCELSCGARTFTIAACRRDTTGAGVLALSAMEPAINIALVVTPGTAVLLLSAVFAVLLLWGVWAMRSAYVGWAEHQLPDRALLMVIVRVVAMYLILTYFLLS